MSGDGCSIRDSQVGGFTERAIRRNINDAQWASMSPQFRENIRKVDNIAMFGLTNVSKVCADVYKASGGASAEKWVHERYTSFQEKIASASQSTEKLNSETSSMPIIEGNEISPEIINSTSSEVVGTNVAASSYVEAPSASEIDIDALDEDVVNTWNNLNEAEREQVACTYAAYRKEWEEELLKNKPNVTEQEREAAFQCAQGLLVVAAILPHLQGKAIYDEAVEAWRKNGFNNAKFYKVLGIKMGGQAFKRIKNLCRSAEAGAHFQKAWQALAANRKLITQNISPQNVPKKGGVHKFFKCMGELGRQGIEVARNISQGKILD